MGRTRQIDFEEGADSRRFVTALARGLDVLACFSVDEKWLTNTEIAARTNLPKPTVVRLAYTLCVQGYLRHSRESGKYALGDSVAALGITMVSNLRLRRIARPYMQDLADRYDISVSLGIRNGLSVLYLENCRSGAPLSLGLDIGSRIPIADTAMGHAMLAVMEPRERDRLLAEIRQAEGERWPQARQAIDAGCAHWQARGFTIVVRDWQTDISGVAAAIRQPDGRVVTINAGGQASKFPRELLDQEIGPQLARMVKGLESFVRSEEM
ncbi:IclR family transcriptional regulator [Pseudorhodoferax soli]|uniref:IclR family transcriptional regulator n=1 Tax=Pseudorhodoferax soli TaxID=545864 RepID=A0A368XHL6_9BURK|nr:IclR family transcriptional regulator [Pseudorhodoferax soli]RCW67490.1 IclR family transcriptional regulator [Pseudorhodoferax soli]